MATAKKTPAKKVAAQPVEQTETPEVDQAGDTETESENAPLPVESVLNGSELDEYRQRYPKGE